VNAVIPLLRELINKGYPLHISTVTVTGLELVKRSFRNLDASLAPLDIASLRDKQLDALSPALILVVETEIWPMLLDRAAYRRIPVLFINARMSKKSAIAYGRIQALIRYIARSVKLVLAQSDADRDRFHSLLDVSSINAGNLKYCLTLPLFDPISKKQEFGFDADDLVLVWGSSRPGEEALILDIYAKLKEKYPTLRLVLAPRHPKRCDEVEKLLRNTVYRRLSDMASESVDIVLIDTLGQLAGAYTISDIAIVGGSFYDYGGHNPLEPAFYAKAIIIGEYHHSCKASVEKLLSNNAIIVSNKAKLEKDLVSLLQDAKQRQEMGERAKIVLTENADALQNHMEGIERWMR
jgi:3-deoxy-D-manno-octulosonic-acid transferase